MAADPGRYSPSPASSLTHIHPYIRADFTPALSARTLGRAQRFLLTSSTDAEDVTMDNASTTNGEHLDSTSDDDDDDVSNKSLDIPMGDAPRAPDNSGDADVPDTSIWVRDGSAQREVFAFRQTGVYGSSFQLLLRMTTREAAFALFDIVSAKMFNRTLDVIKAQPRPRLQQDERSQR
ncbi:hypothetical protein LTR49_027168 [Elasticomyces elasticus]|nr:hypothetical protein LTR49_027168 [Elasticomyces elasticus]